MKPYIECVVLYNIRSSKDIYGFIFHIDDTLSFRFRYAYNSKNLPPQDQFFHIYKIIVFA